MKENERHIELIAKILSNNFTQEEKKEFETWLNERSENRELFEEFAKSWDLTQEYYSPELSNIDLEDELKKFKKKRSATKRIFAYIAAASLILLLGLFSFFGKKQKQISAGNQIVVYTLADKSLVTLDKNSYIKFSDNFMQNRMVFLKGRAYFEVKHIGNKKFKVKTDLYTITVLGTKFMASPDIISVDTGKVMITVNSTGSSFFVNTGQTAVYDSLKRIFIVNKKTNPNTLAWKTLKFVFDNTSLSEIAAQLQDVYDIKIKFDSPQTASLKLTATFEKQSIDEIFRVLELTLNLQVENKGSYFFIKRKK